MQQPTRKQGQASSPIPDQQLAPAFKLSVQIAQLLIANDIAFPDKCSEHGQPWCVKCPGTKIRYKCGCEIAVTVEKSKKPLTKEEIESA